MTTVREDGRPQSANRGAFSGGDDPYTRFDVGQQSGHSVSNIGRDQYVSQVIATRESFARDVAATKTKARYLVWIGLLVFIAGFVVTLIGAHQYVDNLTTLNDGTSQATADGYFRAYASYALGGGALCLAGLVSLVIGIVLHVVAASRRKQLLVSDRRALY
jgi:hypothetical protein